MSTIAAPESLTDFLLEVATDEELKESFLADPVAVGEAHGLTSDQLDLLRDGDLATLRAALDRGGDDGGTEAIVWYF